MAEIFIGIEREFDLEIDEDVCEYLYSLNELVEFLSKNPHTKWEHVRLDFCLIS